MKDAFTQEKLCADATPSNKVPKRSGAENARSYSVIIPCFNGSDTLERAILSAERQSVGPAVIIVVDDGSADIAASAAIIRRHAPLARLITQDNRGPAAARNAAAQLASSNWLAFLDADDTWHVDKMARQLDFAINTRVGLILDSSKTNGQLSPAAPTFDDLWQRNWVRTSAAVVRREAFLSIGGFDEDRELVGAEDYNLWLRLRAAGWQAVADSESLIRYTPAADCISTQIERCARGELHNICKLQIQLHLDAERVERKRQEIRIAFGRDLLHHRKLPAARAMLATPASRAMPEAVKLWLATLLPEALLDLRRSLRARVARAFGLSGSKNGSTRALATAHNSRQRNTA